MLRRLQALRHLKGTDHTVNKPGKPLTRDFYSRDPRKVSRDLLGKILVRRQQRTLLTARIVEVEAYLGQNDPAAIGKLANFI